MWIKNASKKPLSKTTKMSANKPVQSTLAGKKGKPASWNKMNGTPRAKPQSKQYALRASATQFTPPKTTIDHTRPTATLHRLGFMAFL
jgi:hypothetical protein